jgi:hypothetical protein
MYVVEFDYAETVPKMDFSIERPSRKLIPLTNEHKPVKLTQHIKRVYLAPHPPLLNIASPMIINTIPPLKSASQRHSFGIPSRNDSMPTLPSLNKIEVIEETTEPSPRKTLERIQGKRKKAPISVTNLMTDGEESNVSTNLVAKR